MRKVITVSLALAAAIASTLSAAPMDDSTRSTESLTRALISNTNFIQLADGDINGKRPLIQLADGDINGKRPLSA